MPHGEDVIEEARFRKAVEPGIAAAEQAPLRPMKSAEYFCAVERKSSNFRRPHSAPAGLVEAQNHSSRDNHEPPHNISEALSDLSSFKDLSLNLGLV